MKLSNIIFAILLLALTPTGYHFGWKEHKRQCEIVHKTKAPPNHWAENAYYEGMIEPDPNYIPSIRDDPEIREAIRKHQIRLRDTGPGFYGGEVDGRVGEKTRTAYDNYVIWYMGKP